MRDLLGNMITGNRTRILLKNISNEYTISITHDNMDYLEELICCSVKQDNRPAYAVA